MDHVAIKRGARLKRAIVDRYNIIEAGATIGYDLERDRSRYTVTDSGIVVLAQGQPSPETISFAEGHS
jgi:glucose-1-phosphate adenylyltransferase